MSLITTFWQRHTRHATPVLVAGLVFILSPGIVAWDEAHDHLDEVVAAGKIPTAHQFRKPRIRAAIFMLAALGGLMNQSIGDRRRKLSEAESEGKTDEMSWVKSQLPPNEKP